MRTEFLVLLSCLSFVSSFAQHIESKDSLSGSVFKESVLLDEVVVSADEKSIGSRGLGNIRINMEQMKQAPLFLGERDVIKSLQILPGVSAGMEGSSQLNIRGGTNDQTLYLVDDVPIYSQNHTFGLFSIFNSDVIRSVDLYKGGIPTKYGDKLSGVVAVELKTGDFKNFHNSLSLGVLAGTITSEGPIVKNKLSYLLSGRRSFIDLIYKGLVKQSGDANGGSALFSFYDLNGKLTWKVDSKKTLSVVFYNGYDDLYGENNEGDRFKEKFGYGWKTCMGSLKYQSQFSQTVSLSASLYYANLNNFRLYKSKQKSFGANQKIENKNSQLLTDWGGKISCVHQTVPGNTLYYGIEGAYQLYKPDYMYKEVNKKRTVYHGTLLKLLKSSGYVYDELSYGQWLFSLGLRTSFYKAKTAKLVLEPRLKVNTFIGEKNKIMLAYDRNYQPVHTINEMDYNSKTDFWIPFQESLLPNSDLFSIGWKNYASSNFTFSAEFYYKTMKNLVLIRDFEYYLDWHTDFEQGRGHSMGLELMAEYRRKRVSGWFSYTVSNSQRIFKGRTYPFKYNALHDLSAFISYVTREKKNNYHTFSLQMQYRSGYPYYIPEVEYPGMGLPTHPSGYDDIDNLFSVGHVPRYPNVHLKDFLRFDVNYTIDRKLKHGSISWQFSLLNIFNRKNPYAVYRKDHRYKAFVLVPLFPSISVKRSF